MKTIVLGPDIFASADGEVICWKGRNYVPQLVSNRAGSCLCEDARSAAARSRPEVATMPHDQVPEQPVCWPVFLLALNRLTAEWYAAHRQRWVIGMIREPVQQTETRPEPAGGEEVS